MTARNASDFRRHFGHFAETLAFAAAGGLTLGLGGVPGGWLSGGIVAVAIAALAGRPMLVPVPFARANFILIGITLGAVVTPETVHGIAHYPASIAVLLVAMALISVAGTFYLRAAHRWDTVSAFLAASPGGLSQVMVVGAELGADLRGIAIVQTIRVMVIAIGLPGGLALLGLVKTSSRTVGGAFDPSRTGELALLIAASAVAGLLAFRFRVPGGLLFGAMLCSAALHGSGLVHVPMPWWVATAASIVLGAVAGSRFANTSVRLLLQFLAAAFGTFAISVTIAAVFAVLLINMRALHIADVVLAFAPGSVDVMMLLALALNIDPVFVGTHHLARIFFVMLAMPVVARRASHRRDGRIQGRETAERGEPPRRPPFQD